MPSPVPSLSLAVAALVRALSVLVICGQIAPSQVLAAAPVGPLATARLIAAPGVSPDGAWTIGIVIALQPKAITYWRDPGEAGVPPMFDFSASTNVATSTVAFPAPKRIHEGDIDAVGYDGEVVFPVRIAPADPKAKTVVKLRMDYATCERVCLPARADLTLDLPAPSDAIDAARLVQAQAAVPQALDAVSAAAVADVVTERQAGGVAWRVRPKLVTADMQLFAEAPDGFFLTTTREGDVFRVAVSEHPADRASPESVRFTLVGPTGAVEFSAPKG